REALESAGFTPEDSQPGMICAIDSSPDPCPEEFDGNFWSYWNAEQDGEWETYEVGADDAEPAPGSFEGRRYFDGSEGPQATPAEIAAGAAGESDPAEDDTTEEGTSEDAAEGETDSGETNAPAEANET